MIPIEAKIAGFKEFKHLTINSITEVQHGTINRNFIVSSNKNDYFVRLNNPSVAGVNRELEAEILLQLNPLLITPKIIANNISEGYLILEYLKLGHWNQENCLTSQEPLLQQLSKIHQIQLPNHFPSLLSRLEDYERKSQKNLDDTFFSCYYSTKNKLKELGFFEAKHLVHFDLNSKNLLGTQPVYIIDWEFAGSAHPIYDCALFLFYNDLSLEKSPLIVQYCKNYNKGEKILKLALGLAKYMTEMWETIEKNHLPYH